MVVVVAEGGVIPKGFVVPVIQLIPEAVKCL